MSVFISYNYQTGAKAAREVAAELELHGIDPWWLPDPVSMSQLDTIIETALASCQRSIVIWSAAELSQWQMVEIEAIRQRLLLRHPPSDPTDFFMVLRNRGNEHIEADKRLPLLENSEYVDYGLPGQDMPDLSHMQGYFPGLFPLRNGAGQRPYFHPLRDTGPVRGKQVLSGGFKDDDSDETWQYCWVFLEDDRDNWYIQQPRPTVTHSRRWIAPAVHVGFEIQAAVLVSAGPEAHRIAVNRVLKADYGGFPKSSLRDAVEIDRLTFLREEIAT